MRKTTLVVGAGASKPYGFPTGVELIQKIVKRAGSIASNVDSQRHYKDLATALTRSGVDSIDAFLNLRPEFMEVGKLMIACEIYEAEQQHKVDLFSSEDRANDWIRILFNQLPAEEDIHLKIVSFNYDRLLEHKLICMMESRGYAPERIQRFIESLEIVHIYGRLPWLPLEIVYNRIDEAPPSFQNGYGLFLQSFGNDPFPAIHHKRLEITKSLKILKETVDTSERARAHITWAERLIFLGSGYHQENMALLGFEIRGGPHPPEVHGTTFGMPTIAMARVADLYPFISRQSIACHSVFTDLININD